MMPMCLPRHADGDGRMIRRAAYFCSAGCPHQASKLLNEYLQLWTCLMLGIVTDLDLVHPDCSLIEALETITRHDLLTPRNRDRLTRVYEESLEYMDGRRDDLRKLRRLIEVTEAITPDPFEVEQRRAQS